MKYTIPFALLLAVFSLMPNVANTAMENKQGDAVYLIIGQSNAYGEATIWAGDSDLSEGAEVFNKASGVFELWNPGGPVQITVPAVAGGSTASANYNCAAFHMAKAIHRKRGEDVKCIVNAEGGRPIERWIEGPIGGPYTLTGPMAVDLLAQITAASGQINRIDGIVVMHGESNDQNGSTSGNSSPISNTEYANRLAFLLDELRALAIVPDWCPAYFTTLAPELGGQNVVLQNLDGTHENNAWPQLEFSYTVETSHFATEADGVHWTGKSSAQIGQKLARAIW